MSEHIIGLESKLDELRNRLESSQKPPDPEWEEGQLGNTVDWTKYDVSPEAYAAYNRAKFINGKWVVNYTNFTTINDAISKVPAQLEDAINGSPQWKIVSVLPNGSGMISALLTCTTTHELVTPSKLDDVGEPQKGE